MGYSHYCKLNKKLNEEVLEDVRKIVEKYSDIIQFESDDNSKPLVSLDMIRFNGIGEDAYEAFVVEFNEGDYCKTARRPYDLPVCEVLLVLKHHYKDDFELSSDGFWVSKEEFKNNDFDESWNEALENVERDFGYEFKITHKISNSGGGYKYYKLGVEV